MKVCHRHVGIEDFLRHHSLYWWCIGSEAKRNIVVQIYYLKINWFCSNIRENNLTGPLPAGIGNCTSFQILYAPHLFFKLFALHFDDMCQDWWTPKSLTTLERLFPSLHFLSIVHVTCWDIFIQEDLRTWKFLSWKTIVKYCAWRYHLWVFLCLQGFKLQWLVRRHSIQHWVPSSQHLVSGVHWLYKKKHKSSWFFFKFHVRFLRNVLPLLVGRLKETGFQGAFQMF